MKRAAIAHRRVRAWALGVLLLAGCASAPAASSRQPARESEPRVVTLNVTERALEATIERGSARISYVAERGAPLDPGSGAARDAEPPARSDAATLLTDRNGHVISVTGDSFAEPGKWKALLEITPTRTGEQLDEDLQLARHLPDVLAKDERVQRWFRWQLVLLRAEVQDLLAAEPPPS